MPADESVNATAQEYYCRLTDAGAALEAAAHAAARPVVLTHVAVGDGNGEVPAPAATATSLANEVYRRQIDGRERDKEDPNIAWLHIIIPADVGGFWIREFGIYAQPLEEGGEPVLYACGNHAPYYKQQTAQGQATTHELSIPIILSGTAEVEISVKDAGYASQLAFEDLRDTVMADRERLWENDGEGPQVLGGVLPLATAESAGIVQPDGRTTTVDEAGRLSALGGNLLLNSEEWITASGTFTAPVTGWYYLWMTGGGNSGSAFNWNSTVHQIQSGFSGGILDTLIYLEAGQSVDVAIGAGGIPTSSSTGMDAGAGGVTSFGALYTARTRCFPGSFGSVDNDTATKAYGGGIGGGTALLYSQASNPSANNGVFYGAGGGSAWNKSSGYNCGSGMQGAILLRYYDPAKANGPLPEPALFSARRLAPRAAAAPATVNLYDPETGQGSVWREEDAPAKLAEGLITEEAWQEICAAKAAEERAAWLADPDTGAERFALLRAARGAKLAATDYLVAPDYPLTDEQRASVTAYRQALRDLPAQEGAPWDGGGEETPWPEEPTVEKVAEQG